ncbi:midnolin [Tympanuchus pallidicinctus]|uniref:midnolin n=1 Tax=Tympanuchus pallidicinctus TaxID=109042 RepID=UPI0022876006|nr:midnolin [Tympanuchus pallidicinctus]XP_052521419.1 midnolin [Tympanuchus pallidicinctus]
MEPQPGARSCSRGAAPCDPLPAERPVHLCIHTTTGARYEVAVPPDETVEGLKRRLSQRLKVPKERLALLHKDSRLSSGKLQDLGVVEGSKLTLVPTVEAGLMSQASRPEQSVMQALESLTETQVSSCETKSSMGRGCRGPSRPHPLLPSSRSPSGRGGDAEGGAQGGHWVWGGPTLHPTASSLGRGGCGAVTQPRSYRLYGGG